MFAQQMSGQYLLHTRNRRREMSAETDTNTSQSSGASIGSGSERQVRDCASVSQTFAANIKLVPSARVPVYVPYAFVLKPPSPLVASVTDAPVLPRFLTLCVPIELQPYSHRSATNKFASWIYDDTISLTISTHKSAALSQCEQ
ncbi:hypothetical protein DL93DRAFT_1808394 [Clavulina sp. PMI_390]|nr:hypothetical protein DL93DRAFT_1808394 [Clavulina sp. PMI_390]